MRAPKIFLTSLRPWQQRILLILLVGTVGVALGLWQPSGPMPAPPSVFTDITGKQIDLQTLRGKPVLVTFWATDCHSCVEEIPHLAELYQQYHKHGLEIIAVAMYHDIPSHVVEMTRMKQIPYTVALDVQGKHAHDFGRILVTPTTFLISPEGFFVKEVIGKFTQAVMQSLIEQYLLKTAI